MRSAASLSYEAAQAAIDGRPDDRTSPLMAPVLRPLFDAYAVLKSARETRSPLEIESAERRIHFGADGRIASIATRESLPAHRLIEEFMIQANVSAAETLEQRRVPLIYRVHDAPSDDKVQALVDFLGTLGISWSKGQRVTTERFNRLLDQARGGAHSAIVNEVVLRTQSQAIYSIDNIGHFGLNLDRYAHFTSPIRRYADLLVHRALLEEPVPRGDELKAIADQVSATERRATAAERAALDRYRVRLSAALIGHVFSARVSGVARFGLFVRLADSGTDGLVPLSGLPVDNYRFDRERQRLTARHARRSFGLGDTVTVRLIEADPIGGRLVFRFEDDRPTPPHPGRGGRGPRRRRP
jgi:ribonuclease R